ncbi:hypothetical protein O1C99_003575 [Vibrio cholerae]|uniref:hypothetical protein n=1 Tax=Vibrio cholerae TaxID=666 RepID=UPI001A1F9091|nr:hypothetical protein [Vibrio cholerae]EGQ7642063.1 hypothetical protein [Vibrio cholerae]EKF9803454.1 hypothetical protein [Vibrio cholerae]MBO1401660.1 hypothetical protein [Vibrio cholerae]
MSWTVERALDEQAIEKCTLRNDGVSLWLKGIDREIKITLSVNLVSGGVNFHANYAIKTPEQISAYIPSREWGDDQAYALHLAVTSFTQHYDFAVKNGHKPSNGWLIPR